MASVQQRFADADIGKPLPPVGSTAPLLRLSRPYRSADELGRRLVVMLASMGLTLDLPDVLAWSEAVSSAAEEPSVSEPLAGLVVTYDRELDDLLVVDTSVLDTPAHMDTDIVPWDDARRVARVLVDQGIVDSSLSLDVADVAFVRSGVKGPDGTHERWVDEIIFEANPRMDGIEIIDAGLRIGITPAGDVSSVRITGIDAERIGTVTIGATLQALETAFVDYVMSSALPLDAAWVGMRRPVYMLDPSARAAIIEPRYSIEYAIVVRDDEVFTTSRSMITLWSITSPVPMVEARLPATRADQP